MSRVSRDKRQIIVLGMHRSGTSAVTGLLQASGAYVGQPEELTKTTIENPRGFFERKEARAICDALLHAAGADWWKVRDFDARRIPAATLIAQDKAIQALVSALDSQGTWALKEPRLCFLLPEFRRFLKTPVVVFVVRHPVEIVQSLRRRNGFQRAAALALWEAYVVAALRNSADLPRAFVSYADLVRDPDGTAKGLRRRLEQLGIAGLQDADSAGIVDPSLHREHLDRAGFEALMSPEQRALWSHLAKKKAPPAALLALSESARLMLEDFEIDRTAELEAAPMRAPAADLRKAQEALTTAGGEAKTQAERAERAEAQLRQATAERQSTDTALKAAQSDVGEWKQRYAVLEGVSARLEKTLIGFEARTAEQQSALSALRGEYEKKLVALHEEGVRLRIEAAAIRTSEERISAARLAAAATEHRAELAALRADHERVKLQLKGDGDRVEDALAVARGELENLRSEHARAQAELAEKSDALAAVGGELEKQKAQSGRFEEASNRLQKRLEEAGETQAKHQAALAAIEGQHKDRLEALTNEMEVVRSEFSTLQKREQDWESDKRARQIELDDLHRLSSVLEKHSARIDRKLPALSAELMPFRRAAPPVPASGNSASEAAADWRTAAAERMASWKRQLGDLYTPVAKMGARKRRAFRRWLGARVPLSWQADAPPSGGTLPSPTHKPPPPAARLQKDIALVADSALFDKRWYLGKYNDVARQGIDPVSHYIRHGARERRDPGPGFSTDWYLSKYEDVRRAGLNPLVHYLRYGQKEGRQPVSPGGAKPWWDALQPDWTERSIATSVEPRRLGVAAALERMAQNPQPPAIIIPVYNAPAETEACLASVLRHTRNACRIVVIDDASPDPAVGEMLARYEGDPRIEVFRNEANLGFARTVNRGIELAGRSDVVFLNSDTKVTPGWLRNLRIAAYSGDRTGTATPFSNNAGAFSAPEMGESNDIPPWLSLDDYGRSISQVALRSYPTLPTGHGFCMYVRRDCIDETGLLDAEAFPCGYGEENDFCMRAGRLGWQHVIDDATLIYHVRSASFGEAKTELMERGRKIIDSRYPEYSAAVRASIGSDALKGARERVRLASRAVTADKRDLKPRILYVLSTTSGGTPQTNQDLMAGLSDRVECFVLRCDSSTMTLMHFHSGAYVDMEKHRLEKPLSAFPHRSAEYDAVASEWLVRYAIELVHIRHIAWHGLGLIDAAKQIGLPVVFSFHDFYTVCPTVNLLDENYVHCGGRCTPTTGECSFKLWPQAEFPPMKHAAVADWRRTLGESLTKCDAFVTTAASAKRVLIDAFPFLEERRFQIIPHGRNFKSFEKIPGALTPDQPLRILVPGNLSRTKGAGIVAELGRVSAEKRLEVHIVGSVEKGIDLPAEVVHHGSYARERFVEEVRPIRPHVGGVFSICPETYCHTLTELWASGLPVIGFDIGAVGDRIRESGGGWLARAPTAEAVLEVLEQIRSRPDDYHEKVAAVHEWQKGPGRLNHCLAMSHAYFDIYRDLMVGSEQPSAAEAPRPRVALIAPGVTVSSQREISAPGSVHVRLVEKTCDSLSRPIRFDLVAPTSDLDWLTRSYDAALVQRTALTAGAATELLRLAGERKFGIMLELDDDLIELAKSSREGDDYFGRSEAIETLAREADLVFVSTEMLRDRIAPFNRSVLIEPNAISAPLWLAPLPAGAEKILADGQTRRSEREVRAVYMGSWTHAEDLAIIREAVESVRSRMPEFRLFVVGITNSSADWYEAITVPNGRKNYPDFVPWVRRVFATMDFAVAPLADTPFNRAKSELKYLEYAAAGLACVASDVGAYGDTIRHGETGLLTGNTTEAWAEQLLVAATDPKLCAALAGRARAEVIAHRLVGGREAAFDQAILGVLRTAAAPG